MWSKLINKILYGCVAALIGIAVLTSTARLATPWLTNYRSTLEDYLSNKVHMPVSISRVSAAWYGFQPVIELTDVTIKPKKNNKKWISIHRFYLGINLWRSIWDRQWQPGLFRLDGVEMQALPILPTKQKNKAFPLLSQMLFNPTSGSVEDALDPLLKWLFQQQEIRFNDIHFRYHSQGILTETVFKRLRLINRGGRHRFEGAILFQQHPHASIRLVGDFVGDTIKALEGKGYVSAAQLPLSLFSNFLPESLPKMVRGHSNFELWFNLQPSFQLKVQSKVTFQDVLLHNPTTNEQRRLNYLFGRFFYNYTLSGWSLFGKQIETSRLAFLTKGSAQTFSLKHDKNGYQLNLSQAKLGEAMNWLKFLGRFDWLTVKELYLHGLLKDIQFQWQDLSHYLFSSQFKDVGVHNKKRFIVDGLEGRVYVDETQGELELNTHNGSLSFHDLTSPLLLNSLSGIFRWRKYDNMWRIASENSHLKSENFEMAPHFSFDWRGDIGNSYLNLDGQISSHDAEKLKSYLPKRAINPKLYAWLSSALVSIPKLNAHIWFKGQLNHFPFDKENGEFKVDAHAYQSTVKFHPKWPQASAVDARVHVDKRNLMILIDKARLAHTLVEGVHVLIKPLGKHVQHLFLEGKGKFAAQHALDYILQTPLKEKFIRSSHFRFKGDLQLGLQLILPLYPEDKHDRVTGQVTFLNNDVEFPIKSAISLHKVQGTLHFNEVGIMASRLRANFLGAPLTAYLKPSGDLSKVLVGVVGSLGINKLKMFSPYLSEQFIKGLLDYKIHLQFPKKSEVFSAQLTSDLKRVFLLLPSPFTKPIGTPLPLKLFVSFKHDQLDVSGYLKNKLASHLRFYKEGDGYVFGQGAVNLGAFKKLALPARNHLSLTGKIPFLSVDEWQLFYKNHVYNALKQQTSTLHFTFEVLISKLSMLARTYKGVSLKLSSEDKGKKLTIQAPNFFKGDVYFPLDKTQSVNVNGVYLFLHTSKDKRLSSFVPADFPNLSLKIQNFQVNNILLGTLFLQTHTRSDDHLSIDKLELKSKNYELNMTGNWYYKNNLHSTKIKGYWVSHALKETFKQWRLPPVVDSKQATLSYGLTLANSIFNFNFEQLKGTLSLNVKRGRITHLDKATEQKIGLGKLLSILSLQTIPRRLVLDFSDLSRKGLSFDTFKGNYLVRKGVLTTTNSYLDGPVAYISLNGQLNLVHRYYDLTLKVTPHITASFPIVATIAGGPLAGIATWLASKVIHQGMRHVSGYTYKITGPWQNPMVQPMKIHGSKKAP